MRRTIVRYVCVCLTMVLTMISPRVKKRFPTLNNLVEAGLLLENEKIILDNLNDKFPKPSKHWYEQFEMFVVNYFLYIYYRQKYYVKLFFLGYQ